MPQGQPLDTSSLHPEKVCGVSGLYSFHWIAPSFSSALHANVWAVFVFVFIAIASWKSERNPSDHAITSFLHIFSLGRVYDCDRYTTLCVIRTYDEWMIIYGPEKFTQKCETFQLNEDWRKWQTHCCRGVAVVWLHVFGLSTMSPLILSLLLSIFFPSWAEYNYVLLRFGAYYRPVFYRHAKPFTSHLTEFE